jgi:DNA helicase-2/ATP-dependent DNA helicase PcrA
MSEHEARFEQVASRVCGKPAGLSAADCYAISGQWNPLCREQGCCRIWEKTDEQLRYAAFPGTQHAFLQACPGSGKTEVVGLKAAYEMAAWDRAPGGMAVLTFTNSAADVIRRRVSQFIGASYVGHPHYVGTLASWLHGYVANPFGHLITGYQGDRSGDRSVRLVDASSSSGFLNSFTANWQGLRANEYHYAPVSGHLEITRRTGGRPEEWQKRSLRELKERFLSQGFATYEDVEWICHELLCGHPDAAAKLARRFPLVVIDECQDLSDSQLAILDRLRQAGSALHFVGDLNQAIYAFRKVDPRNVQSFSGRHGFIGLRLSRNFRSCQPIVSLCAELAGTDHVHGRPESGDLPPCLCCTYEKGGEIALARWFAGLLDARGLDRSRSAIVARGRSVVDAFTPGGPQGGARSVEGMALALHLWRTSRADCRDEALRCVGGFLSERLLSGCHCGRDRYYRPEGVRSSLSWRLSLSHILDACQRDPRIGDLGQTWSA